VSDDRVVPHDLDAERALLGSVLLRDAVWAEVASEIEPRHFFRDAHRVVYEAMRRCKERDRAIGLVTVKDALGTQLEPVGGPAYLASLVDGMPLSINVRHYAAIVREKALLRDVIDAGNRLVAAAYGSDDDPAQVLEEGVRELLALAAPRQAGPVPLGQAVRSYVDALDTAGAAAIPTGYTDLDDLLGGGVRRKELTIVAARPSVGKTSFALGAARHAAGAGYPGVVFSLEMSKEACAGRLLSAEARVALHRSGAAMSTHDGQRMAEAWAKLDALPLLVEDAATTLTQIDAWCHRLAARPEGLAWAVVDFVQHRSMRGRERHDQIAAAARGLKRTAVSLDLAVLACSQLNRAPEGRQDKRPHMSDLKESGALEEAADVGVLLFREEMHKATDENRGVAEAIVAKQRNGPTGVVRLFFRREFSQFCDLALPG
jgi:replicative DNA helicase